MFFLFRGKEPLVVVPEARAKEERNRYRERGRSARKKGVKVMVQDGGRTTQF